MSESSSTVVRRILFLIGHLRARRSERVGGRAEPDPFTGPATEDPRLRRSSSISPPGRQPVVTVILTALGLEYDAVRSFLTDTTRCVHPAGTCFETGTVRGTSVRIALAQVGVGNRASAVLAERAIAAFRPNDVMVVGIAGALHDDIAIGDVIVATRIYGYDGGKEEPAEFLARPRSWDAPHFLIQQAQLLARTTWWTLSRPECTLRVPVGIHFRPIAAGEIVMESKVGHLAGLIRQHYNDVAAIEMESAGAAEAAHLNRALPLLTIRGISDHADCHRRSVCAAGSEMTAAIHAAAFALGLIVTMHGASLPLPGMAPVGRAIARHRADEESGSAE